MTLHVYNHNLINGSVSTRQRDKYVLLFTTPSMLFSGYGDNCALLRAPPGNRLIHKLMTAKPPNIT